MPSNSLIPFYALLIIVCAYTLFRRHFDPRPQDADLSDRQKMSRSIVDVALILLSIAGIIFLPNGS